MSPSHRHPAVRLRARFAAAAALVLALLSAAAAQDRPLAELAPPQTILAVGLAPHALPEGDLDEALGRVDWEGAHRAWEALRPALEGMDLDLPDRLGAGITLPLVRALAAGDGDVGTQEGLLAEAEAACPGLGEASRRLVQDDGVNEWLLTVSMDAFAPFPAGLLAVRATPEAVDAAAEVQDRLVSCFASGTAGSQSGSALHVIGDGSDLPLVVARHGSLFLAGTRPDVVRAAIRREAGSDEASFAHGRIGESFARFGPGLRVALDTRTLADLVETRLPPMGGPTAAVLRERGVAALRTFGGVAFRLDVEDQGLVSESLVAFDRGGGDERLAALLACDGCRASGPFLAPVDAVSVASGPWRPAAWISYLDSWVVDLSRAAGEPTDLRTLLSSWAGVDLDVALLDWIGSEAQVIRLEPFSPDLRHLVRQPPSAVVIPVTSPEAAREGVQALAEAVVSTLMAAEGSGADLPSAEEFLAMVSVRERRAGDVPYYRIRIGPTSEFAVGTVGSRLVLASPASAFDRIVAVERGEVRNGFSSPGWQAVAEAAGDRIAWSYGRGGADLRGLADLLDLAAQPLAFATSAVFIASVEEDSGGVGGPFGESWEDTERTVPFGGPVDVGDVEGYGDLDDLSGVDPIAVLEVPSTLSGTLGPDSPLVSGTPMDPYRIEGLAAGDVVTVEMTSAPVDTYLYLIDAGRGRFLAEVDDSPTTDRSEIVFVADGDTELWIGASSFGGFGEGSYELRLSHGASETAAPFGGPDAPLDVATAERYDTLSDLPDEAPRVLDVPAVVSAELAWDDDDSSRLNGDLTDLYELQGLSAGDVVTVEMTSDPVDTYLYLIDAEEGGLLYEVDDSPDTRRSLLRFVADGDARLWIGAGSWSGTNEGPYRLTVTVGSGDGPADAVGPSDADDAADGGDTGPGGESSDDGERVQPPTFDELMPLFEVVPEAVRTVADRLGTYVSTTVSEDDVLRTVHRQAFDW